MFRSGLGIMIQLCKVTVMRRGGHFAAMEQPGLLAQDTRNSSARYARGPHGSRIV